MNPTFEKNAPLTDQFCFEFVAQNSDGIFRIEFSEPIPVAAMPEELCEAFYARGFPAGFNDSFGTLFARFSPELFNFSALKTGFETLNPANILRFFQAECRLDNFETSQTGLNGQPLHFANSLLGILENDKLICVWGKIRDITAEKSAELATAEVEKHWQLTQKIEALGRLAGGIAHDFNNFLAVMMLQNDMLNLQLPSNSPLRHRIEEMRKATNNATAMVKQLLAVGRKQTLNPKPTVVNNAINEFAKILASVVTENIEVVFNLEKDSGICFVDQNQLIQTLSSLALNACEAMPDGGQLTIETNTVVLDKSSIRHKSQPEGSFVQITVSDNGIGMDSATLDSVFEPFFSAKKSAKGVGLGLATAYGFVKQSKGFIWAESELNIGTTFKIQFPRIDQPPTVENT